MRLKLTCLFTVALVLFAVACSSDDGTDPPQSPPEQPAPEQPIDESARVDPLTLPNGEFNERDVEGARTAFTSARAAWQAGAPADYLLQIGAETVGFTQVVVEGGVVVSETTDAAIQDWGLPRSIEQLFDEIDAIIAAFEADPSLVPAPDACGQHFRVRFDSDLGYPTSYDELGPCDDGVGITVIVTPT